MCRVLANVVGLITTHRLLGVDELDYNEAALRIWHLGEYMSHKGWAFRTPGYPLFLAPIAAFSKLSGWITMDLIAGYQILWSGIGGILLCKFARIHATPQATLGILFFYCLYPPFLFLPFFILSENAYFILLLVQALLWHRVVQSWSLRLLFLSGISLGIGTLIRGEHLLFTLIFLAYPFFRGFPTNVRWINVRRSLIILPIIMLILSPWFIRNLIVFETPVMTTSWGSTLWGGYNAYTRGADLPASFPETPLNPFLENNFAYYIQTPASPNAELEKNRYFAWQAYRFMQYSWLDTLELIAYKAVRFWTTGFRDFHLQSTLTQLERPAFSQMLLKVLLTLTPMFFIFGFLLRLPSVWRTPHWYWLSSVVFFIWLFGAFLITVPRLFLPILPLMAVFLCSNQKPNLFQLQKPESLPSQTV